MKKVKDLILYHVATDRNLKVGDKLHFGDEYNAQYEKCVNISFNKDGKAWHRLGFENAKKGIFKNKDLMVGLSHALSNYDFIMRDFALEEVRKQQFPKLPSRFKCIFLTEDEDTCLNNLEGMKNRAKGKHLQAIKVKVNGNAHFVRDYALSRDGLSFEEYKEEAIKYWSQDQNSKSATKEILFVGDVEVIEILKEI